MTDQVAPKQIIRLTPEIFAAQGQNDRDYLTHRMKVVLEAMDSHPKVPIDVLSKIADGGPCGQGCCCCGGACCMVPRRDESGEMIVEAG
jgi:hypothetical protein